jgi:hypothetical protein
MKNLPLILFILCFPIIVLSAPIKVSNDPNMAVCQCGGTYCTYTDDNDTPNDTTAYFLATACPMHRKDSTDPKELKPCANLSNEMTGITACLCGCKGTGSCGHCEKASDCAQTCCDNFAKILLGPQYPDMEHAGIVTGKVLPVVSDATVSAMVMIEKGAILAPLKMYTEPVVNGKYSIELPPGNYEISVNAAGYRSDNSYYVSITSTKQEFSSQDFKLIASGLIKGTILHDAGDDIWLNLKSNNDQDRQGTYATGLDDTQNPFASNPYLKEEPKVSTSTIGHFQCPELPEGEYKLQIYSDKYGGLIFFDPILEKGTEISISEREKIKGILDTIMKYRNERSHSRKQLVYYSKSYSNDYWPVSYDKLTETLKDDSTEDVMTPTDSQNTQGTDIEVFYGQQSGDTLFVLYRTVEFYSDNQIHKTRWSNTYDYIGMFQKENGEWKISKEKRINRLDNPTSIKGMPKSSKSLSTRYIISPKYQTLNHIQVKVGDKPADIGILDMRELLKTSILAPELKWNG